MGRVFAGMYRTRAALRKAQVRATLSRLRGSSRLPQRGQRHRARPAARAAAAPARGPLRAPVACDTRRQPRQTSSPSAAAVGTRCDAKGGAAML